MAHEDDISLDDLVAEYLERTDSGEKLDANQFIARWPQHRRAFLTFAVQAEAMQQWVHGAADDSLAASRDGNEDEFRHIAGYRLTRRLGRGGMASVYEALPPDGETPVAIKILNVEIAADPTHRARFEREAQAIRSIDHAGVVPLYEAGQVGDTSYLTMQLIDGINLEDVLAACRTAAEDESGHASDGQPGKGSPTRSAEQAALLLLTGNASSSQNYYVCIAELLAFVADALHAAHEAGVIHRDVKPSNLLLDGNGRLWLTDFGLSCLEESQTVLTQPGDLLGTPRYMSPEQALGLQTALDHRTDVYSLGATLYELSAFQPAYSGTRLDILAKLADQRLHPPTAINGSIPRSLEAIILKAMAHRPADRYASAAELADDLRRFSKGQPTQARHPTLPTRIVRWTQAHPGMALTAIVGCLAVVLAFGAGQYLNRRRLETLNVELSDANRVLQVTSGQLQMANSSLDAREAELRRQLYAADLSSAYDAFDRQQMHDARRLLERQQPADSASDLRGLEWRILDALTTAVTMNAVTWDGHTSKAGAVAAIPNSDEFLTAGHDGFVRKWSLSTGEQLAAFDIGGQLDAVAVTADGTKFAVGKNVDDGINPLTVRSSADGAVLQELTGHSYTIDALDFSLDGRFLASAARYEDVIIHDLTEGQPAGRIENGSRNEAVALSADGESVAAIVRLEVDAAPVQSLQIWRTDDASPLNEPDTRLVVNILDDFADGRRILVASHDQLAVCDVLTGTQTVITGKVPGRIRSIAVSPNETTVAAATDSGLLYWWRLPGNTTEQMTDEDLPLAPEAVSLGRRRLTDVEFANADSLIVTAEDGRIHRLDLSVTHPRRTLPNIQASKMTWDSNGRQLIAVTREGRVMRVDPKTMEHSTVVILPNHGSSVVHFDSQSGEIIVVSGRELTVVDNENGRLKSQLVFDESGSSFCRSITMSPDRKTLYLFHSNHFRVINTDDWSLATTLEMPDCRGDVSPDGKQLLIASGNELQLRDKHSLQVRQQRASLGSEFSVVQYSPTGRYIAVGREDGSFDLLDGTTLETIVTLQGHQSTLQSIEFYDSDRRVVSCSPDPGELIFWDVASERQMGKLMLDRDTVGDVLLSERDSWIAISSDDNPLEVWRAFGATGQ